MRFCVITFRSVMPAQRADAFLRRKGYACRIQRTPRWMEEQGCGYCLRIPCGEVLDAARMLRREELPFRKVYMITDGQKAQQMQL